MKKIIFLSLIILLYACQNKIENEKDKNKTTVANKAGVGIIALHPKYLKSEKSFFELFNNRDLDGEKTIYNPRETKNSQDIKPKFYDTQKQIFQMICLGWRPGEYKVVVNSDTGQEMHMPEDTNKYIHLAWRVYLPKVPKIWRLDPASNPIRKGPSEKFKEVIWDTVAKVTDDFIPLETEEQWIKIQKKDSKLTGWIRWAKQSQLQIDLTPVAISEIYEDVKDVKPNGRLPKKATKQNSEADSTQKN